ncbi:phage tail protein I [Pseudomonas laurentiana]|uniref:Phage tail protein I n=1 Tax=Pseudomonas laurentiana TaxID=2364649 RepID=A0A6I5RUG9_9PSED|nr:phage tail protein I [Pseudomonas laurentiana]NES11266.1 phage tail protein I [Pseudomonas laurentiana]GGU68695.1 phage tail protein I [Pseudomonas laurentiana]
MKSLLPPNSTSLERAIESAAYESPEIPLRTLYNPDTCPAHLLHQLAWAWSVDRWDETWSEAVKRSVCRSAFYVHSRKGTIGAIRRVVEPLGYLLKVTEWWQTEPMDEPGTFALDVGVLDTGISEEMYAELTALIDDAKPVSRHMKGLNISLETPVNSYVGIAVYDGDQIDVYPWENPDIDVQVQGFQGVNDYTLDEQDVYLNG